MVAVYRTNFLIVFLLLLTGCEFLNSIATYQHRNEANPKVIKFSKEINRANLKFTDTFAAYCHHENPLFWIKSCYYTKISNGEGALDLYYVGPSLKIVKLREVDFKLFVADLDLQPGTKSTELDLHKIPDQDPGPFCLKATLWAPNSNYGFTEKRSAYLRPLNDSKNLIIESVDTHAKQTCYQFSLLDFQNHKMDFRVYFGGLYPQTLIPHSVIEIKPMTPLKNTEPLQANGLGKLKPASSTIEAKSKLEALSYFIKFATKE